MAKGFNLTAQINLQGPSNLKPIVADIKRQLGTVSSNVKINLDAKSAKAVDNVTSRLQAMNAVLVQAKQNTDSLSASLRNLSSSLGTVQSAGSKTSSAMNNTAVNAKNVAKNLKVATTEMEEFGKQSALAIRRFAAFSIVTSGIYGLINAINSGFKAFINFDKELIKLQQVTGKGATGIALLEKSITSLATSLGVSSESLISVASTLAQAGLSAEDTRIALAALAKTELAPSFDNLTDTTEGAIAALRQFELQAGELEGALGSINAVAAAFAVESKDIISAIQRTGGVFAAASKGVSEGTDALNEFVAIFTSVRQTTRESAETIATGLRTIFTRIQRARTIDQLKQFGVELTDLEGKFVGPYEAIKRLSEGLRGLDPRDLRFSQIVEELGGFRQIGKVIPLIQQFAVAQEALKVAQKGQGSLAEAQVVAQKSLANQIAKVREQFLALIRDVGKSSAFQGMFQIVTGLTSGLISLAGAFKPILPILAIMGTVKGIKAIGEFGSGFVGGLKKGGGAGNVGSNIGGSISGAKDKEKADATNRASKVIQDNTNAIQTLTSAINKLTSAVSSKTSGSTTLNSGGIVKFATGGVVPGSGNRDTVPALLTPGEFVIRKKAVETIGAGNLHKMNKYALGGKVELSGQQLKATYRSLSDIVNNKEKYTANVVPVPIDDISIIKDMKKRKDKYPSMPQWKNFEVAVGKKYGLPTAGGNKFLDYPSKPGEAKFLRPDQGYGNDPETGFIKGNNNETMLAKLIGAGLYRPNRKIYTYYPKSLSKFNQFAIGGLVQKFAGGGKALGARSKFKELTSEEMDQLSTQELIQYGKDLAQDIFTTGGAGMAVGHEFIEVPKEKIIPELDQYLTSYIGKRGFWKEKIARFGQPAKITKNNDVSNRQNALESQVARQADEVAAREQNWTAIKAGSAIDNYLLQSLQDPILTDYKTVRGGGSLDKAFHNTRLRQAVNKALENYDDFDYSAANIDKLVSSMAAKRFMYGGPVQKFMAGGVAESLSADSLYAQILELGNPQDVRGLAGGSSFIDQKLKAVQTSDKPATSKEIFKKNFLLSDRSKPYLSTIQELLEIANSNKKRPRIFTDAEKASATKLGLVGMFPFGVDELLYEQIGDRIVAIQMKSLTQDKAGVVDQMRKEIDAVLGRTTASLYGTSGQDLSATTKEGLGLGNLEGYMIEAILAKAGANPGKLDDRSVDYASGLGNAASLFGIDPNIPTEVKRDVKGGLSKARDNFKNYFAKFAFGGKATGPSFEDVRKQILDKYPQINFRISKRKRGFGYNILGGLKQEGDNVGNYADFQQASNLEQLSALADKMANQLQYVYGPDIDPSLLKKKQKKFALGGLAEATGEMSSLMSGLYGNRSQEQNLPQKKEKEFGKIGLRSDGSEITATYFKNQTREGFVTAKKAADNLYTVGLSKATKGYGPRLYDVVMEAATAAGGMLTSDRNSVSGAARAVWDYYFNNRGDVKKTPLDPSQWTKNQSLIDPKLYGKKETWPPSTDPAWILQSGYSKNAELINSSEIINMNDPKYKQFLDSQKVSFMTQAVLAGNMRNNGGSIKKFAKGGSAEDTVPALLTPGEFVINKKAAKRIGYNKLHKLNKADKLQGYNKGGSVGMIQKFGAGGSPQPWPKNLMQYTTENKLALAAEQAEFFAYKAKEAGQTVSQFSKTLATKVVSRARDLQTNLKNKQTGLKYSVLGQADELKGSNNKDILKKAVEDFSNQIQEIDPSKSADEVKKTAQAIVRGLRDGLSLDAIKKKSQDVADVFSKVYKEGEATQEALKLVAKEAGMSSEALQRGVGSNRIRQEQFIQSDAGQSFGRLAQLIPDKLEKLSKTGFGKGFTGLANALSGKGLSEKLEKSFGKVGGFIGDKLDAIGGPLVALGTTAAVLGEKLPSLLGSQYATSTTAAGVAGGIGGAGQGLASGALLGMQIAGPVGAMIAGITGAVVGGISGAFEAFNQKKLENNLKALEKTSGDLSAALKRLSIEASDVNIKNVKSALGADLRNLENVGQQAQFGASGSARDWLEFTRNLPLIGGLVTSVTGGNQEAEARQAVVAGIERAFDSANRLGDINRSGAPLAQIQGLLSQANQAAEDAGGIKTEAGQKARDEILARGSQAYQQLRAQGASADSIFKAAGMKEAQQQGRDVSKELKMPGGEQKLIEEGKRALAIQEEAALKQELVADAMRNVSVQSDNLIDMYRRMQAGLERLGQSIDTIKNRANDAANVLMGQASITNVDRRSEQVLGNISAYSSNEVASVAEQTAVIAGGGEEGKRLADQIKANKLLTDQLPKLLKGATGQNVGGVVDELEKMFAQAQLTAPAGLFDSIEQELQSKLQGREESSIGDLAEELDIVGIASKTTGEALKTSQILQKQYNDATQTVTDLMNQYGKALNEATEWQLRATDIRARADIQLAETLGKTLSLAEQNAPQQQRILGLTGGARVGGVFQGGSTDPNKIFATMTAAIAELGQAGTENKPATGMYAELDKVKGTPAEAEQLALIAKQNNAINNSRKALEELANDGSAAANALKGLQEQQKVAAGSVNFLQKVLTSDAAELDKMNKGLAAYTKLVSGKATAGDINSLQFRQQAFGGLQEMQGLLPDSVFNQMQAKMSEAMIDAMPGGSAMLDRGTGALFTNKDGKQQEMTFRQALRMRAEGKDPVQQQFIDAYNAAVQAQQDAAKLLATSSVQAAETFKQAATEALQARNEAPQQILERAKTEAEAVVTPPTEKPRENTLVKTEAQLDAEAKDKDPLSLGLENVNTSISNLTTAIYTLAGTITALVGAIAAYKTIQSAGGIGNAIGSAVDMVRGRRRRTGFGGSDAPSAGSRAAGNARKNARYDSDGVRGEASRAPKTQADIDAQRKRIEAKRTKAEQGTTPKKPVVATPTPDVKPKVSVTPPPVPGKTIVGQFPPPEAPKPQVKPDIVPPPVPGKTIVGQFPPKAETSLPKSATKAAGAVVDAASSLDEAVTVAQSVANIASGKGTAQDVVYGATSALEIANQTGVASKVPGLAKAGAGVSGTSGFLALNTVISGITNALELAMDPAKYSQKMQDKSDTGLERAQTRDYTGFITDSLYGALEGLMDPIGKIVEAGYVIKDLYSDVSNTVEAEAKTKRIEQKGKDIRAEQRGEQGKALNALPMIEQNRAMEEAQNKLELKKAQEIKNRGGSLADFAKTFDVSESSLGVGSLDELIAKREATIQALPQDRMGARKQEKKGTWDWSSNADPKGFSDAVQQELEFRESQLGKPLSAMEQMANEATKPGSIYTHDIHLAKILEKFVGGSSVAGAAASMIDNESLKKISEGAGQALQKGAASIYDTLTNTDKMKNVTQKATTTLLNPNESLAKGKDYITSFFKTKSPGMSKLADAKLDTNNKDIIKYLTDPNAFNLKTADGMDVPTATTSCECDLLTQILAAIKDYYNALNQKITSPTSLTPSAPIAAPTPPGVIPPTDMAPTPIPTPEVKPEVVAPAEKEKTNEFTLGEDYVTRAEKQYAPTPERKAFVQNELKDARKRARMGKKSPTDDSVISASTFELRNIAQAEKVKKREEYLLKQNPKTRARLMTKAEKEAGLGDKLEAIERDRETSRQGYATIGTSQPTQFDKDNRMAMIQNNQDNIRLTPEIAQRINENLTTTGRPNSISEHNQIMQQVPQQMTALMGPVSSNIPKPVEYTRQVQTTENRGSLDGGAQGDRNNINGMNGSLLSIDPKSLAGLTTFNSSFATYVDKLVNHQFPPIEGKVDINHKLEVNMTGAASIATLEKRLQELAVALIAPKIEELRKDIKKFIPDLQPSGTKGETKN